MIRLLIRAAVFLGTAALGLLVTAAILPGFGLSLSGLAVAVAVFAVCQSGFALVAAAIARKYAPALVGAVGLVSTFAALLIATLIPGGLVITGAITWVLSTLFVWLVTALASWLLPSLVLKDAKQAP